MVVSLVTLTLLVKKYCNEWYGSSTVDYMLVDESIFHLTQFFIDHNKLDHLDLMMAKVKAIGILKMDE